MDWWAFWAFLIAGVEVMMFPILLVHGRKAVAPPKGLPEVFGFFIAKGLVVAFWVLLGLELLERGS